MQESSYICKQCNSKVAFERIRYDAKGNQLLCLDCFKRSGRKTELNVKPHSVVAERIKVRCSDCGYKFRIREEAKKICPYCSGMHIIHDNTTAQDLVTNSF